MPPARTTESFFWFSFSNWGDVTISQNVPRVQVGGQVYPASVEDQGEHREKRKLRKQDPAHLKKTQKQSFQMWGTKRGWNPKSRQEMLLGFASSSPSLSSATEEKFKGRSCWYKPGPSRPLYLFNYKSYDLRAIYVYYYNLQKEWQFQGSSILKTGQLISLSIQSCLIKIAAATQVDRTNIFSAIQLLPWTHSLRTIASAPH